MIIHRPDINEKLCFVIMPFTERFTKYYNSIIKPVVAEVGLEAVRSDEIYGTTIIYDIWNSILKARVVIADVTTKNPNVNYELGLCHAIGVTTILITNTLEDVPFDYCHHRCIIYDNDNVEWENEFRTHLKKTLEAVIFEKKGRRVLPLPISSNKLYPPFINIALVVIFMNVLVNVMVLVLAQAINVLTTGIIILLWVIALNVVVLYNARKP